MKFRYTLASTFVVTVITFCTSYGEDGVGGRWAALLTNDTCTIGGENYIGREYENVGFGLKEWQAFLGMDPNNLVPFLKARFTSTNETLMHVCCWHYASEGELAVYACQHVVRTNWFNCSDVYSNLYMYANSRTNWMDPLIPVVLTNEAARWDLERWFTDALERQKASSVSPEAK